MSFPTGSSYICNPPVTNTDIDEMFYVTDLNVAHTQLLATGWTVCGGAEYERKEWSAYRSGRNNALLTDNPKYFLAMYHATETAKVLNLQSKADRIALFAHIMSGVVQQDAVIS